MAPNVDQQTAVRELLADLPVTIATDLASLAVVDDRRRTRGDRIATLTPEGSGWYVSEADAVLDAAGVRGFVRRAIAVPGRAA